MIRPCVKSVREKGRGSEVIHLWLFGRGGRCHVERRGVGFTEHALSGGIELAMLWAPLPPWCKAAPTPPTFITVLGQMGTLDLMHLSPRENLMTASLPAEKLARVSARSAALLIGRELT